MSSPSARDDTLDELSESGERIEALLAALAAHGPAAQQRAEDLVAVVTNLYGAGLERILDLLADAGRLDQVALDALADDQLVSWLLLVHGLHPYDVGTRVAGALDAVRPYLGSHGGDVELLGVDPAGVVRIRLLGSCDGCPSSSVTLQLAVEGAIQAAAPEVTAIEVEAPPAAMQGSGSGAGSGGFIPVDALRSRLQDHPIARWLAVPELAELTSGQLAGFRADGIGDLVVCRLGEALYAYLDQCPACGLSLAGGRLERRPGDPVGAGILRCPACRSHFDLQHAGAGLDAPDVHLEPVPLLVRDGVPSLAAPTPVA